MKYFNIFYAPVLEDEKGNRAALIGDEAKGELVEQF